MSDVATLELSKKLYELSDWWDTPYSYGRHNELQFPLAVTDYRPRIAAAYDVGYVLRRLAQCPGRITLKHREQSGEWFAKWDNHRIEYGQTAETPQDAVVKLAIELFNQGVLQKEVA